GIAPDPEAPRHRRPSLRVVDADARAAGDCRARQCLLAALDPHARPEEVGGVERAIDAEGLAELARAVRQLAIGRRATALAHERHALDGLERTDEDGMWDVRDARDHVELMVHAVDEVDVGGAADAVHRLGPPGAAAAIGMRGAVRGPAIRLGLDDGACDTGAIRGGHDEALAEEIP